MQKNKKEDTTPEKDDPSLHTNDAAAAAATTVEHVMSSWRFVDPATRSCNARAALRAETLRRMELYVLHILHSLCSHKSSSRQASQQQPSAGKPVSMRVLRSLRETLLVLQLLHENVCHNTLSTQRDIYYHLVREACQASRVAEIIQQLAQTLRLPRQALGVTAGMRGAVGGTLRFHGQLLTAVASSSSSSSSSSSTALSEGIAMPVCEEELRVRSMATPAATHYTSPSCTSYVQPGDDTCEEAFVVEPQTRFILVIEKHTVFYKLMQERLYSLVPCVMLTAQGFPTHAARVLLHNLHAACPDIPVVGLVDYNPSGLAILMQYRLGNAQLQERACYAVPALRWLGLRTAHLMPTSEPHGNAVLGAIPRLLPRQACTARDQAVLRNLLTRLEHVAHYDEEKKKEEEEDEEEVGAAEPASPHGSPAAGTRSAGKQQQQQHTAKKPGRGVSVVPAMREEDKASIARWHSEAKAMQHYDIKVEIEAMNTRAQWGVCIATPSPGAGSDGEMCEGRFAQWVGRRLLKHDYI